MAEFDDKLNQILSNPDAMAQIARLAQSLNAPPPPAPNPPPVNAENPGAGAENPSPATDADSVARFLPLLRDLGGDSDARRLLYAMRPYLRPQKQEKVERALRLARLFRVGKQFLSQWEG